MKTKFPSILLLAVATILVGCATQFTTIFPEDRYYPGKCREWIIRGSETRIYRCTFRSETDPAYHFFIFLPSLPDTGCVYPGDLLDLYQSDRDKELCWEATP